MSTVHISDQFGEPRFSPAWRDSEGQLHATITFGHSWVEFSDTAAARAFAGAAIKCAQAMEALPPAPEGGQS